MVPVRLRLKNFLSYGESAGELDFEAFDIACLSGGNGQGKSALLDAMTWALWGEARKAAGAAKPDEELLRVGARAMEVEFTFDVEGTRYRVVRSYVRSVSGKTSRPGLELHVMEAESRAWHPITSENLRATQAEIERRIGIDYDTFINSSLLLQGRSDEFTRRRPAERKEVLGRILGLDRYERLAAAAAERHTAARDRVRAGEESAGRLRAALEPEPEWRREHADVSAAAEVARAERDAFLAEESRLTATRDALDEDARRAESHRLEIRRLEDRRAGLASEEAVLGAQIAEAEALMARADEIEAAQRRHTELQAECARMDTDAARHRGFEHEIHALTLDVAAARSDMAARLSRAEADTAAVRDRIAETAARLATRPAAEGARTIAAAADEAVRLMDEGRRRRDALLVRRSVVERTVERARAELEASILQVERELVDVDDVPARVAVLRAEAEALAVRVEEIRTWESVRAEAASAGAERKAQRDFARDETRRLREEVEGINDARARALAAGDGVCPTCGTPLSPEHRHTVVAGYEAEVAALEERIRRRGREAEKLHEECQQIAARFTEFDGRITTANGAAGHHAQAIHEIARLESLLARAAGRREELVELRTRIGTGDFAVEARSEVAAIESELHDVGFDERAFEEARREAAHLQRWEETLRDLNEVAARHIALEERLGSAMAEVERLSMDAASDVATAPARARIAELEACLAELGYGAAAHQAMRAELVELANAPAAVARLAAAYRDATAWSARVGELAAQAADCERESVELRAAVAALEQALAERPALVARLEGLAASRRESDAAIDQATTMLGALSERLARAALDRSLLEETLVDLKQARKDTTISRYLRQAFGAHGIPSLIIEETLPEVEERANEMLQRLSGGRTRVALETQREKRTGGTRETLEIRITDEQGAARPYETYSGGEAFRVDFALRIALAQLLADRAGVRIRTLVVDEGFGTQDQEGLQGLIEAIGTVKADFDKILVITHLEELKDAFPVRIEVTKDALEGSSFQVVGA